MSAPTTFSLCMSLLHFQILWERLPGVIWVSFPGVQGEDDREVVEVSGLQWFAMPMLRSHSETGMG